AHTVLSTYRLTGVHHGVPVLDTAESPEATLYAVDLSRFATLIRYRDDSVPQIQTFGDDAAAEILRQQPRLIVTPSPESGLDQERIRQLQLRVGLEIWETYESVAKDPDAVLARPLVGRSL